MCYFKYYTQRTHCQVNKTHVIDFDQLCALVLNSEQRSYIKIRALITYYQCWFVNESHVRVYLPQRLSKLFVIPKKIIDVLLSSYDGS